MSTQSPRHLLLVALVAVSGCVAVDSRVDDEVPSANGIAEIDGRYFNWPSYTSSEFGLVGPSDLGELFGAPIMGTDGVPTIGKQKVDTVSLTYSPTNGLVATFERAGTVVGQSTITEESLQIESNKFVLNRQGCGDPDSIQIGCMRKTTTFFVNEAGDLVVAESGGGAGLVAVLPFAIYGKLMSIFPRVR